MFYEATLAKWQLHRYLLTKWEHKTVIVSKHVSGQFNQNEGVTLLNNLILVKILNAWVKLATVETSFMKVVFSCLVLIYISYFF